MVATQLVFFAILWSKSEVSPKEKVIEYTPALPRFLSVSIGILIDCAQEQRGRSRKTTVYNDFISGTYPNVKHPL
jgi:hypothetical protein